MWATPSRIVVIPASEVWPGFKCKTGVSGEIPTKAAWQIEALVDLLLVYVSARFITNETVTFFPVSAVAQSGIKSATREFSSPYSGI
jgi:hypothetical protein